MLKSFYEFEKCKDTDYDRIREYCRLEKVNEEQLRLSAGKKERKRKHAGTNRILSAFQLFGKRFSETKDNLLRYLRIRTER